MATPIGHLEDITLRAVRILAEVEEILCEDTRHSARLLSAHGIVTPTSVFNDHNKERRTPALIERLQSGARLALICDAGTPGVADEAFYLVRACRRGGVNVVPVPGPSSILAALVASGLPTDRFGFEGFAPKKSAARQHLLRSIALQKRTAIVLVSPYQVRPLLEDAARVIPDARVVLARELTKLHEEFMDGTPIELLDRVATRPRGEWVAVIHPGEGT